MNSDPFTSKKRSSFIDILIVGILLFSFSLYNYIHSCQVFSNFSFDYQIPISWQFTSLLDLWPYRDIYYPYGILFYEKYSTVFFGFLYLLLNPLLFLTVFLTIRRVFKERIAAYIFFIGIFVFINFYTTIEVFNRYGITVSYVLLLAYLFHRYVYLPKKFALLMGVVNGIVFSLVHDQEIYCFLATLFFFITNPMIREGKREFMRKQYYEMFIKNIVLFFIGFILSILPFVAYLFYHNLLMQFGAFLLEIADFGIYAKTPFLPYSGTIDNIFIYIPLLITIFFLIYTFSSYKKELPYSHYVLLSLLLVIILLEQKSMVRSISSQLTFVAFLLGIVLLSEIDTNLLSQRISKLKRIVCYISLLCLIFVVGLQSNKSFVSESIGTVTLGTPLNMQKQLAMQRNQCLSKNIIKLNSQGPIYKEVVDIIKKDKTDAKIFSYLSDPIYYVLFGQIPPYYWTIYEASPLYAQQANIRYMQQENIQYIIYNTDLTRLSDGVPVYARGSMLLRHVLTNFTFFARKGNFIILKKNRKTDIFSTPHMDNSFSTFLLNIDLGAIPKSEGQYKYPLLLDGKNKNIITGQGIEKINEYLSSHTVNSKNIFLILAPVDMHKDIKRIQVEITTKDNKKTTILMNSCSINSSCIINLGNMPLFYKERVLSQIDLDKNFKGTITLLEVKNREKFW